MGLIKLQRGGGAGMFFAIGVMKIKQLCLFFWKLRYSNIYVSSKEDLCSWLKPISKCDCEKFSIKLQSFHVSLTVEYGLCRLCYGQSLCAACASRRLCSRLGLNAAGRRGPSRLGQKVRQQKVGLTRCYTKFYFPLCSDANIYWCFAFKSVLM